MDNTSNKRRCFLICLALALATFAVYWRVYNYDFSSYDDADYVTNNANVKAGLTYESIIWAFATGHAANWHPLTWLSLILDCQLFGADAGWLHLTNLLLHVVNTLLLFIILTQMTGAIWRSAFVAAAFALHPLHIESVAWISERKDVLSTLFWILTMGAYVRYVRRPSTSRYLLALLIFALGLMAKPMLVTLPFVLLLLDYWPLGRLRFGLVGESANGQTQQPASAGPQPRITWRLLCEKVPFFVLSVLSSIITFAVQHAGGAVSTVKGFPLSIRIANASHSYIKYIGKMIWPSRLAIFYPFPERVLPMWQAALIALFMAVISILLVLLARRHKYLPVGWFWYLGTLIPVIGLVQVGAQAMADRYTYIPLIGLFIIIAWGAPDLLAKWRHRRPALCILALMTILAMLICTHFQLRHWRDGKTIFEWELAVWPAGAAPERKADIHEKVAEAAFWLGKLDQAISHHKQALKINSNHEEALNSLAWILATAQDAKLRNPQDAINYASKACALTNFQEPQYVDTLAAAYAAAGRFSDAVTTVEKALELVTDDESKKEFQERLNLYKAGKPYIEPAGQTSSDSPKIPLLLESSSSLKVVGACSDTVATCQKEFGQIKVALQLNG